MSSTIKGLRNAAADRMVGREAIFSGMSTGAYAYLLRADETSDINFAPDWLKEQLASLTRAKEIPSEKTGNFVVEVIGDRTYYVEGDTYRIDVPHNVVRFYEGDRETAIIDRREFVGLFRTTKEQ